MLARLCVGVGLSQLMDVVRNRVHARSLQTRRKKAACSLHRNGKKAACSLHRNWKKAACSLHRKLLVVYTETGTNSLFKFQFVSCLYLYVHVYELITT